MYKISITIVTVTSLPSGVTARITGTIVVVTTITGVATAVSTILSKESVRAS